MKKLTKRQTKVLGVIWSFIRTHGHFPSYSDLMQVLDVRSKQTIADFFKILERENYIRKKEKISLTGKAIQYLIDQEVRSIGLDFPPKFDFFPVTHSKNDSTVTKFPCANINPAFTKEEMAEKKFIKNTDSSSKTVAQSDQGNLPFVSNFPYRENTARTSIYIIKNIVFQNAAGQISNEGDHTKVTRYSSELSLLNKPRFRLKIVLDKLFDFLKWIKCL